MYDKVKLIKLVEERDCLWDIYSEGYHNGHKKRAAWREICREFHSDWNDWSSRERRAEIVYMQIRWKNLRRTFEQTQTVTQKNGYTMVTEHVYKDFLQFLMPLMEMRAEESSASHQVGADRTATSSTQTNQKSKNDYETHADLLFFKSLLPDLRDLSKAQKKLFRVEVKKILQTIKNS